jgi:hypothetical protein
MLEDARERVGFAPGEEDDGEMPEGPAVTLSATCLDCIDLLLKRNPV